MLIYCSALMKGIDSHKKIDLSGNPILRHYYTNRVSLHHISSSVSNVVVHGYI